MWIMTTAGFVSAVQLRNDHTKLMVRGRDKKSLENMLESIKSGYATAGYKGEWPVPKIFTEPKGEHWDYAHRVTVSRTEFKLFLSCEVDDFLDYENFKNAATVARGEKYHKVLMSVWSTMHGMNDRVSARASAWTSYKSKYSGKTLDEVLAELPDAEEEIPDLDVPPVDGAFLSYLDDNDDPDATDPHEVIISYQSAHDHIYGKVDEHTN